MQIKSKHVSDMEEKFIIFSLPCQQTAFPEQSRYLHIAHIVSRASLGKSCKWERCTSAVAYI